jgi:hypothetical protein
MSVNTVDFLKNGTVDQNRCWSPAIWGDCPVNDIKEGTTPGVFIEDEFVDFPLIGTQTTQIGFGRYKLFHTASGTVVPVSSWNSIEQMGSLLTFNPDSDNDSGSIAQAYPSFFMSGLASTSGKLWFEARFAVNTLLTDTLGLIIGLAETDQWTLATGVPFNAASATPTNTASFIGFYKGEDALGVVDAVYSDRATAWSNIKAGIGTLAAAYTFMKVGIVYDPDPANAAKCVRFFVDNVESSTYMTNAQLVAKTNLDANALGLIAACVADASGTTAVMALDAWRCFQLYPRS